MQVFLFTLILMSQALADPACVTFLNSTKCQQGLLTHLIKDGPVTLENITVEENTLINGSLAAENSVFKGDLEVNGATQLTSCDLEGKTAINGNLKARRSTFLALSLNGAAKLTQVTLKDKLTLNGTLKAEETFFKGALSINSSKITFINSSLKSLTIKDNLSSLGSIFKETREEKPQEVYLLGNTLVEGDIIFKKEGGKVYKAQEALIQGKVIKGEVIEIN